MIIYIVQPGDFLSIIATRFNVSVREIIEDNWVGMGSEMLIVPGQILFIRREDHKHTHGNVEFYGSLFDALSIYKETGILRGTAG